MSQPQKQPPDCRPVVAETDVAGRIQNWSVIEGARVVRGYTLENNIQPGRSPSWDELVYMDSDGDSLNASTGLHISEHVASVNIAILPETPPADAVRILRKVAAAIEAEGLPSAFVVYTEHPIARRHGIQDGAS